MTIGIILAKNDSRRLFRKNTILFCGYPLFVWSIVQSLNSHRIDKTYVSTDDKEIARISENYGAEVIWRDYEEADDAPAGVPMYHALGMIEKTIKIDEIVNLLPTTPIRFPDEIDKIIELKQKLNVPLISTLAPQGEAVEFKIVGPNKGKLALWDKNWHYCTQGGGTSVEDFLHWKKGTSANEKEVYTIKDHRNPVMYYYPVQIWQQFDIDYKEEFELLEVLMKHYILKGKRIEIYEEYGKTNRRKQNTKSR